MAGRSITNLAIRLLGALLFVVAGSTFGLAQQPVPARPAAAPSSVPSVRALKATGPIVIDGRLNEADWERAEPATNFIQRDPDEGKAATERTEVRVLYDADAVYFGARMFDGQAAKIVQRLTRRDDDPSGIADSFIIGLDPLHDHLTGALFAVSAAGSLRDGILFNDSSEDDTWDGVWEAAVAVDDKGWTAEIRIPFSQLRFSAADRQTWGVNFIRNITRLNEQDWWSPTSKKESANVSRAGHLTELEGVRGRRHLDLLPYATSKGVVDNTVESGNPFTSGRRLEANGGLDLKWGVSSSVTVDATINPDFGQVEVDPAVVNLSAFETFYDEKRPFFIEGSDVFSRFGRNGASGFMGFNRVNPTLFYSRRIGRTPQGSASGDFVDAPGSTTILGAAKVTGKTSNGWTFNVIDALTPVERADVAIGTTRSQVDIEPFTNYFAGRAYRTFGQRAGLGVLATAVNRSLQTDGLRNRLVNDAYVVGMDGHTFLNSARDYVVTGAISFSHLGGSEAAISRLEKSSARYFQRPDATHLTFDPSAQKLSGWNFQSDFTRNKGNFRPSGSFWAVSPGYEVNDIGFQMTSDRMGMHAGFNWMKPTPDKLTRYRQLVAAKWYVWNFAHDKLSDGLYVSANATLRNYWSTSFSHIAVYPSFDDRFTRGGAMVRTRAWKNYGAGLSSDGRKPFVVNFNAGYESEKLGSWDGSVSLTLTAKPIPALTIEVGPTLTRLFDKAQYVTTVQDSAAVATFGQRNVFSELDQTEWSMTTRVNFMISPRMSLQVYAQPLLSVGRYGTFKQLTAPRTFTFQRFGIDGGTIGFDPTSGAYTVNPTGNSSGVPFTFDNPDFNFKSLRVNAVYRWEFKPGSTFYLVWTQQRQDFSRPGQFAFGTDVSSLVNAPSNNVVMAKVSYWLSR